MPKPRTIDTISVGAGLWLSGQLKPALPAQLFTNLNRCHPEQSEGSPEVESFDAPEVESFDAPDGRQLQKHNSTTDRSVCQGDQ